MGILKESVVEIINESISENKIAYDAMDIIDEWVRYSTISNDRKKTLRGLLSQIKVWPAKFIRDLQKLISGLSTEALEEIHTWDGFLKQTVFVELKRRK